MQSHRLCQNSRKTGRCVSATCFWEVQRSPREQASLLGHPGLPMSRQRHLVTELEGRTSDPFLQATSQCRVHLTGRVGFDPPSWRGARPLAREPEDREPGTTRRGWQQEARSRVEGEFRNEVFTHIPDQTQALIRSQAVPGAGAALAVTPSNRETTIPSRLFRVVLLRRLRLPLPFSVRSCQCGRPLDPCATLSCSLLTSGGAWQKVVCTREHHGARSQSSSWPRAHKRHGQRRGRPCTTRSRRSWTRGRCRCSSSAGWPAGCHGHHVPRRVVAKRGCVALKAAAARAFGAHGMAVEVGGRWSDETRVFCSALAISRARSNFNFP